MDIHEILEIFIIPNLSNIVGESNITGEVQRYLEVITLLCKLFLKLKILSKTVGWFWSEVWQLLSYFAFYIVQDLGNNYCSEGVLCSSDEDVVYTSLYGCNFDDETTVDYYYY